VIKIHRRVLPGVILCFAGVAIGDDFMADGSLVGVNALQMPDLDSQYNTTTQVKLISKDFVSIVTNN
jgi:hypothetical protein